MASFHSNRKLRHILELSVQHPDDIQMSLWVCKNRTTSVKETLLKQNKTTWNFQQGSLLRQQSHSFIYEKQALFSKTQIKYH